MIYSKLNLVADSVNDDISEVSHLAAGYASRKVDVHPFFFRPRVAKIGFGAVAESDGEFIAHL